ncbi:glycosyltransferase [Solwaraspora sp. WMMD406]|uniref:glycosyltransferase n=1 Tax=Solwaraspora sp. WMMD406 TaxID=3016095 RepID=UPI002415AFF8|nr:glycosyltransferase [Solwaraspora sp. WMMD406]MDG4764264.1 glycosyltransferase [Solwaraspora sp. WMMD406]
MQITVIMPAYNEEVGIGAVLRAMTESPGFGPDIEIVVAANGCTDGTAAVARSRGVRVLEIPTPSKIAALNAADRVAGGDVRVYLDADIEVSADLLRALAAAIAQPGAEAATPRPVIDASASSWPVRSYYAINARLPVFRGRLFGRGVIALSAAARSRFTDFPDIIADDMFLDAVVRADEKRDVDLPVRVLAPRRTGELIRRVARSRAGNAEFWHFVRTDPRGAELALDPVPGSSPFSWLRRVVLSSPQLLPAAFCYVAVTAAAELKRRSPRWNVRSGWGRTEAGDGVTGSAPEAASERG